MIILGEESAFAPNLFIPTNSSPTPPGPTPSIPTTLGSRIDNKATVVGVLQDNEGNDYVLAVVDAAYRSNLPMSWGQINVNTPLVDDEYGEMIDHHTGKYNTDLILSTYNATDYPAFNFARNACTVTIGSNTYYSVLPSLTELNLIYENKDSLDQYDTTASSYPYRRLDYRFSYWASTEGDDELAWGFNPYGTCGHDKNTDYANDVCPVICIPLS